MESRQQRTAGDGEKGPKQMRRFAATVLIAAIVVAACGGSGTSPAASAAGQPAAANAVTIVDFAFNPASLTVVKGTSVTWTNNGSVGHTVTADDGTFNSNTVAAGATFSQTFDTAGTFSYHCSIHTTMTASVTVTP